MTATPPSDLQPLAVAVRARRLELGMSMAALADASALSKDTFRRIEEGQPVRSVTYAKVDSAIGWAVGSCEDVIRGGSATPADLEGVKFTRLADADVHEAITSAMVATTELTAAEIREVTERVMESLRRRGLLP